MMPLQCCRFDISYYRVYGVAAVLMTNEQSVGLTLLPYMVKKAVNISKCRFVGFSQVGVKIYSHSEGSVEHC
ncbi:unnamed protein product, partial [Musa acuminata subsp. burmannicoides]